MVEWFRALRDDEIKRNAGDPGVVLARRLSNSEYNYTIRDLTGVDIQPTREFPVDPSNTAGFDNSGESLTMSPALLKKYLKAAREVANHMVLEPAGFAFAPHPMLADTDRDKYCVHRIIDFYHPQNTQLRRLLRGRVAVQASSGARTAQRHARRLSPPTPRSAPSISRRSGQRSKARRRRVGPLAKLQAMWRALPAPRRQSAPIRAREGCEAMRDYIVQLRKKIEPRFLNIVAGDVNAAEQPFMIWKNMQYATHRHDVRSGAVAGRGRAVSHRTMSPTSRARPATLRPRTHGRITNHARRSGPRGAGGQRARYEAAFAKFCRVFPDMFYMAGARAELLRQDARIEGRYLERRFPQPDGVLPRRPAALRADPR